MPVLARREVNWCVPADKNGGKGGLFGGKGITLLTKNLHHHE